MYYIYFYFFRQWFVFRMCVCFVISMDASVNLSVHVGTLAGVTQEGGQPAGDGYFLCFSISPYFSDACVVFLWREKSSGPLSSSNVKGLGQGEPRETSSVQE